MTWEEDRLDFFNDTIDCDAICCSKSISNVMQVMMIMMMMILIEVVVELMLLLMKIM